MANWMTPTYMLLAFGFVVVALVGLLAVYYTRARMMLRQIRNQSEEVRDLLKKIHRVEDEQTFVLNFIREIPFLTGELNSSMNPRGIPQVLLNVIIRTFEPEQAVVMVRRKKTLAQPDGDKQLVAAAVAAPRASFGHGMVIGIGEGELGFVAEHGKVMDRILLDREASGRRGVGATGLGAFRPDMAAPMTIGDKTLGVIALGRPDKQ